MDEVKESTTAESLREEVFARVYKVLSVHDPSLGLALQLTQVRDEALDCADRCIEVLREGNLKQQVRIESLEIVATSREQEVRELVAFLVDRGIPIAEPEYVAVVDSVLAPDACVPFTSEEARRDDSETVAVDEADELEQAFVEELGTAAVIHESKPQICHYCGKRATAQFEASGLWVCGDHQHRDFDVAVPPGPGIAIMEQETPPEVEAPWKPVEQATSLPEGECNKKYVEDLAYGVKIPVTITADPVTICRAVQLFASGLSFAQVRKEMNMHGGGVAALKRNYDAVIRRLSVLASATAKAYFLEVFEGRIRKAYKGAA